MAPLTKVSERPDGASGDTTAEGGGGGTLHGATTPRTAPPPPPSPPPLPLPPRRPLLPPWLESKHGAWAQPAMPPPMMRADRGRAHGGGHHDGALVSRGPHAEYGAGESGDDGEYSEEVGSAASHGGAGRALQAERESPNSEDDSMLVLPGLDGEVFVVGENGDAHPLTDFTVQVRAQSTRVSPAVPLLSSIPAACTAPPCARVTDARVPPHPPRSPHPPSPPQELVAEPTIFGEERSHRGPKPSRCTRSTRLAAR